MKNIFLVIFLICTPLIASAECVVPNEPAVAEGETIHLFKYDIVAPGGEGCLGIDRLCAGGALEGNPAYKYAFCSVGKKCDSPFGDKLKPGDIIEAYDSHNPPCQKETRECNGTTGILSGSFTFDQCNIPK